MQTSRSIDIQAPSHAVWNIITDIENSASTIRGIERVEVLEPATGPSVTGLKWRETRTWRGREAVETMRISEAEPGSHYVTEADSHGSIYTSRMSVQPMPHGTNLTMSFNARPVTLGAKVLWALTGWMAKRALEKTIDQDLADIKAAAERSS